jgi:hypothetical protein
MTAKRVCGSSRAGRLRVPADGEKRGRQTDQGGTQRTPTRRASLMAKRRFLTAIRCDTRFHDFWQLLARRQLYVTLEAVPLPAMPCALILAIGKASGVPGR